MREKLKKYWHKLRKVNTKNSFIVGVVIVVILMFYWQQVRPSLAKRACYSKAIVTAINIMRNKNAESYLYDRDHWKTYKVYKSECNFWDEDCSLINSSQVKFTFEENIKTNTEPVYIQENLDKIKKEKDFYDDDYNKYYKRCLQSKGL